MSDAQKFDTRNSLITLIVAPVIVPLLSLTLVRLQGGFDADPDYPPMMNALNVLNFHTTGYMDHPGTTVHVLGALILGLTWLLRAPFVGFSWPENDILSNPDLYMYCINIVFSLLSAVAIFYLGWRLYVATQSVLVAAVGQASALLAYPIIESLPRVTPESLLVSLTVFLMAVLVPTIFSARSLQETRRNGLIIGALLGVCLATKITSAPLIFSLFFLRKRKIQTYAIAASIVAFSVSTLPGFPHFLGMIRYFFEILIHTGHAGSGDVGVPPVSVLLTNLEGLLAQGAIVFVAFALCCVLLLLRAGVKTPSECDFSRLFIVTGLIITVQIILVTRDPKVIYLAPACAVACLVNAAVMYLVILRDRSLRYPVILAMLLFLTLVVGETIRSTYQWVAENISSSRDNATLVAEATASDCKVIYFYDAPTPEFKLLFGNFTTSHLYDQTLARLYPSFLLYNTGSHRFETFSEVLDEDATIRMLVKQKCVYLLGSLLERRYDNADIGIAKNRLSLVDRTYQEQDVPTAIYKLQISPDTSWSDIVPGS